MERWHSLKWDGTALILIVLNPQWSARMVLYRLIRAITSPCTFSVAHGIGYVEAWGVGRPLDRDAWIGHIEALEKAGARVLACVFDPEERATFVSFWDRGQLQMDMSLAFDLFQVSSLAFHPIAPVIHVGYRRWDWDELVESGDISDWRHSYGIWEGNLELGSVLLLSRALSTEDRTVG